VPFMYELAFDPDWDGIKLKVCNWMIMLHFQTYQLTI
jgi:hypothetical protein